MRRHVVGRWTDLVGWCAERRFRRWTDAELRSELDGLFDPSLGDSGCGKNGNVFAMVVRFELTLSDISKAIFGTLACFVHWWSHNNLQGRRMRCEGNDTDMLGVTSLSVPIICTHNAQRNNWRVQFGWENMNMVHPRNIHYFMLPSVMCMEGVAKCCEVLRVTTH